MTDSLLLTGFRKTHCLIHGHCLQATWALQLFARSFDHQSVVNHNTIWNWIELWNIVKYLASINWLLDLWLKANWLQIRPVLHNDGQQTAPGRSSKSLTLKRSGSNLTDSTWISFKLENHQSCQLLLTLVSTGEVKSTIFSVRQSCQSSC